MCRHRGIIGEKTCSCHTVWKWLTHIFLPGLARLHSDKLGLSRLASNSQTMSLSYCFHLNALTRFVCPFIGYTWSPVLRLWVLCNYPVSVLLTCFNSKFGSLTALVSAASNRLQTTTLLWDWRVNLWKLWLLSVISKATQLQSRDRHMAAAAAAAVVCQLFLYLSTGAGAKRETVHTNPTLGII